MTDDKDKKQQFNVYLPPELVRQIKHAAVDAGQSLSAFVEDALRAHIKHHESTDNHQEGQS